MVHSNVELVKGSSVVYPYKTIPLTHTKGDTDIYNNMDDSQIH